METNKFNHSVTSSNSTSKTEKLSLWEYFILAFKRSFDYKGRSRRSEYWGFQLFNTTILLNFGLFYLAHTYIAMVTGGSSVLSNIVSTLYYTISIISSVVVLSLYVRRLHDIGKSGLYAAPLFLLTLIYVIFYILALLTQLGLSDTLSRLRLFGSIPEYVYYLISYLLFPLGLGYGVILLKWNTTNGEKGANQWGLDPKEQVEN